MGMGSFQQKIISIPYSHHWISIRPSLHSNYERGGFYRRTFTQNGMCNQIPGTTVADCTTYLLYLLLTTHLLKDGSLPPVLYALRSNLETDAPREHTYRRDGSKATIMIPRWACNWKTFSGNCRDWFDLDSKVLWEQFGVLFWTKGHFITYLNIFLGIYTEEQKIEELTTPLPV